MRAGNAMSPPEIRIAVRCRDSAFSVVIAIGPVISIWVLISAGIKAAHWYRRGMDPANAF
jgi:hypothetical protein